MGEATPREQIDVNGFWLVVGFYRIFVRFRLEPVAQHNCLNEKHSRGSNVAKITVFAVMLAVQQQQKQKQ